MRSRGACFGIDVEPVFVDRSPELGVEADQVFQILVLPDGFGEGDYDGERIRIHAVVDDRVFVLAGDFHLEGLLFVVIEIERQRIALIAPRDDVAHGVLVREPVFRMRPFDVGTRRAAYFEVPFHVAALGIVRRDDLADEHIAGHLVVLLQPAVVVGKPQFGGRKPELRDALVLPAGEFRGVDGHLVLRVVLQRGFGDDADHAHPRQVGVETDGRGDRYGILHGAFLDLYVFDERHVERHPDARHSVGRPFDDVGRLLAARGDEQGGQRKQSMAYCFHNGGFSVILENFR